MPGPTPHPLNVGFAWTDRPGAGRALTAEQRAAFDRDGFVRAEGVLDAATVARVVAEIDPFEAEVEAFLRQVEGGRVSIARVDEITFTLHLVKRSAFLRSLVASTALTDLCLDLIGPDVRLYWDQAVYKKPATEAVFPWHQDNGYAFVEPQQYLTCWIALTDTDEANGCPIVVPGLHRGGTLTHHDSFAGNVCLEDPPGAVAVPAKAGDVVVFSSLTPHCTGPNRTGAVRKSYIVQYAPDGAEIIVGDDRIKADDPERQFPVLVAGQHLATR